MSMTKTILLKFSISFQGLASSLTDLCEASKCVLSVKIWQQAVGSDGLLDDLEMETS